jgi:hypothetical protein
VRGESQVALGVISKEILKPADSLDCDLIVIAPQGLR